jgi:hypothetical protein
MENQVEKFEQIQALLTAGKITPQEALVLSGLPEEDVNLVHFEHFVDEWTDTPQAEPPGSTKPSD